MDKHWIKVCLVGFVGCAIASADVESPKAAAMGAFEAGVRYGSASGAGTQFFIDQATMHKSWDVSEKTRVVMENVVSANGPTKSTNAGQNGSNFVSKYKLTGGSAAAGAFQFANTAAYLEHKADGLGFAVGNMRTPFSIENTMSRFNMPTYYYSAGYGAAQTLGWNYDLGVKLSLSDMIPGNLEVGVFDGQNNGDNKTPALAAKYGFNYDGGDFSIAPSVGTYMGRWAGGPKDLGFAVGATSKFGTAFVNAEWIYTSKDTGTVAKIWDLYVEPGIDLGGADISAKWELVNANSTSDMNLGVGVGKTYANKLRVRATYQATNFSKKLGAMGHDVRLMLGASF